MSAAQITWAGDWLEKHKEELKQDVGKCMYDGQIQVCFIGGPRKGEKFNADSNEKVLYEVEGKSIIKVVEKGKEKEITVKQGEVFVLPACVQYSTTRNENTVGCVVKVANGKNCVEKKCEPNDSTTVPAPLDIQKYIDAHVAEINKGPHQVFGPPANQSLLTLYGKGTHKFEGDPKKNDTLFIIQRGEATYQCSVSGEKHALTTFHLLHVKPDTKCALNVPEGSFVLGVQIPVK